MKKKILLTGAICVTMAALAGCSENKDSVLYNSLEQQVKHNVSYIDTEQVEVNLNLQSAVSGAEKEYVVKVLSNADIMNKPSKEAGIVGTVNARESVLIIGNDNIDGWYRVAYNGRICYVEGAKLDRNTLVADNGNNNNNVNNGDNNRPTSTTPPRRPVSTSSNTTTSSNTSTSGNANTSTGSGENGDETTTLGGDNTTENDTTTGEEETTTGGDGTTENNSGIEGTTSDETTSSDGSEDDTTSSEESTSSQEGSSSEQDTTQEEETTAPTESTEASTEPSTEE